MRASRTGVGRLALGLGLFVLLALAFADFRAKHATVIEPTTRLQADGPRATRPLDPARAQDGLPDRIYWDDDAYYWISYARDSIDRPTLRVRHTKIDNAPYGREVHWCSGPTWLLVLLTAPVHWTGDRSLDESISAAALGLHPLLFTLLLAGCALLISRRAGPLPTLALVACLLLAPVLSRDLSYGTVDHHALALLFVAGSLLCLQLGGAGYAAHADRRNARRWTIASAICAGAGLWVQAIFQSLLLAGILLGALTGGLLFTRRYRNAPGDSPSHAVAPAPELWRTWSRVAAATSLVLYVVEQFPADLGMRLEVNHPLYALALLAGGELTYRLLRRADRPDETRPTAELPLLLLCALGSLAPALAILLGPADWFWLRDPFLQRLHESIVGYRSAWSLLYQSGPVLRTLLVELGALPLLALLATCTLLRHRDDGTRCARITVALAPVLVALVLYLRYARNGGLAVIALIALGFATLIPAASAKNDTPARRALVTTLAILLLLCSGYAWYLGWNAHHRFVGSDRFAPGWVRKMGYRDLARDLRDRYGDSEPNVMTGSDLAPGLAYFGGFHVTAGLYWENRDGLRATAEFFAAHDDEEARRILQERRIGLVVLWTGPPAAVRWHRLRHGHADPDSVRRTLGYRLSTSEGAPAWLEEISAEFPRTAPPFGVKVYRLARAPELPQAAAGP